MNQIKTGKLIRQFRTEMHLTQKQLAERINVSDKAVSKWERGNGCPDISLLSALAELFGTDIRVLLSGEIEKNESEKGDMRKLKFYLCKKCGNMIIAASDASVTCCGAKLSAAEPAERELLKAEDIGGEWYITSDHPMTKEHYISFVAYVNDSSAMIFRQYPEWNLQCTLPMYRSGTLLCNCIKCGLFAQKISPAQKQVK
ncbi:MAG: helix-turn-helix domain-containing protein [Oscillospiraceae bacterium]|nr:helix-turn-helix domain-containing protein [Oscillospiraceae bacterium]